MLVTSVAPAADKMAPEAVKHFSAGVEYVDDPSGSKWEEALREFRAAYAIQPSWKFANNIGLCALQLERDGEAIEAYQQYLMGGGEPGVSTKLRKQIEKDIATLSASLVRVKVTVEPIDALLIDERKNSQGGLIVNQYPLQNGKATLGIHPGVHKITVQASGYVSAEWAFSADPASTHQHEFKLETLKKREAASGPVAGTPEQAAASATESSKPRAQKTPTSVYVGLAATGFFTVAATVTGVMALGKQKDYDNATDPAEADSVKKSGKTFVLLTDIGMGAAVLSAAATAYFYFTAPKVDTATTSTASSVTDKRHAAAPDGSIRLAPTAIPNAAGLTISGKF